MWVQRVEEGHLEDGRTVIEKGHQEDGRAVKEYMSVIGATRGGLNQARREWLDRDKWRLFCQGHPLVTFTEEARRLSYR